METIPPYHIPKNSNFLVLILPMRNGNEILGFKVTENTRSYPTYEEIIKNETRV